MATICFHHIIIEVAFTSVFDISSDKTMALRLNDNRKSLRIRHYAVVLSSKEARAYTLRDVSLRNNVKQVNVGLLIRVYSRT